MNYLNNLARETEILHGFSWVFGGTYEDLYIEGWRILWEACHDIALLPEVVTAHYLDVLRRVCWSSFFPSCSYAPGSASESVEVPVSGPAPGSAIESVGATASRPAPGSASSSTATLFGAELVTQEPGSANSSTAAVHLTCRSESTL